MLGFVPFLYQEISTVADRYLYLPMLGVSLALATWLDRHWSRPMFAITCLLLGALGPAGVAANRYSGAIIWRLFSHRGREEVNPQSCVAEHMLGSTLAKAGRMPEARDHFARRGDQSALMRGTNDLGMTLLDQGKPNRPLRSFGLRWRLIRIMPPPMPAWATRWPRKAIGPEPSRSFRRAAGWIPALLRLL